MKILKSKRLVSCMAVLLLVFCCAEVFAAHRVDRRFVDCVNHTGYYVDINSIVIDNSHALTADIYLVKPKNNVMFMYRTHFDTQVKSYQFLSSKIYQYDTKEVVGKSDKPMAVLGYGNIKEGNNGTMQQVVEFALEWKRTHIKKTTEGELLD